MGTSKPLRSLTTEIISQWNKLAGPRATNWELYEVLNGALMDKVLSSLQAELISRKGYIQMANRIPSYNIHKRLIDKTSKVYHEPALRSTDKESDQALIDDIVRTADLDSEFALANDYLNSMRSFAIEPYLDSNGLIQTRVLGPWEFMPFSDSLMEPDKMTVFVKWIGTEADKKSDILVLSSDDEIIVINTKGELKQDIMNGMGVPDGINPFGRIPVVYKNATKGRLMSFTNSEGLSMAILMPKLFGDINYASKYLCHSIIWMRNVNMEKMDINPDAVLDLGDEVGGEDGGGKPEVGTITPTVDIPNLIASIGFQIQNYFETEGVKTGTVNASDVSGVSKALDEGDITELRKKQIMLFRRAETELFELLQKMQDVWASSADSKLKRRFSPNFIKSFTVDYPELKTMKSDSQRLDEVAKWRDQKAMSRRQLIREMRPEMTESKIDAWLEEIDAETEEDFQRALAGLPGTQPETKSDGTFQEGNEQGNKQTTEGHLKARIDG